MRLICSVQPFIVSARKYRPTTFDDVVGQKHVAETLMHEITQNKLAQAFLFTGPRGVGKTTCARILAKVINSQNGENPDSDFAFNVFELDAASNNAVDDIRNLIEQVRIPPQVGKYKVYIIDEVHMLTTSAFNAFLKTLEEPPSYAIFILATTERHKILPTILSRCQVFNFNRIQISDMVDHLASIAKKESVEIENSVLHLIAEKADGGLRDALSMFDQLVSFSGGNVSYEKAVEMLSILDVNTFFDLTEAALKKDISHTLLTINAILSQGFDGSLILGGFADHIRNLLVSKSPDTNKLLDVADVFKIKYQEQSRKLDTAFLLNALNLLNDADERYRLSRNPRLHIELTLIKLCHLQEFISEIPTLEEVKKKLAQPTQAQTKISDKVSAPQIVEDKPKLPKSNLVLPRTGLSSLDRESIKQQRLAALKQNEVNTLIQTVQSTEESVQNISETIEEVSPLIQKNQVDISQIDSLKVLEKLAEKFGVRVASLMQSIKAKIEGDVFYFQISGQMQRETIEEIRPEISSALTQLTDAKIRQFDFEMIELEDTSRKPYTDVEKLNYLLEKHPKFQEAVEKLKLRLP